MMLFELVQVKRGKEKVVFVDTLPKVNDRMKTLRASHMRGIRGEKVTYSIRESKQEKFKQKPHNYNPSGDCQLPRKLNW